MLKNHPHPGEILRQDVLEPLGLEATEAARRLVGRLEIARTTLSRILNGRAGVSPDLVLRLERAGASTARFWMNLQSNYELSKVRKGAHAVVVALQDDAA